MGQGWNMHKENMQAITAQFRTRDGGTGREAERERMRTDGRTKDERRREKRRRATPRQTPDARHYTSWFSLEPGTSHVAVVSLAGMDDQDQGRAGC